MQTIYRQDTGRITVADAKELIRKAAPIERVVNVYVEVGPDDEAVADSPLIIEQGTARRYDLSIESDFDELCKQLSIEPRNRWRPALTGYKSDARQDALYSIDHMEFVRLAELHGGTVVVRPSKRAKPVVTTSEYAELEKIVDWYNALLGADIWRKLPALKAEDAAVLLSEFSPASTKAADIKADGIANLQVNADEFALMLSAFEALSTTSRSLADWHLVARQLGLTYHDWIDRYEAAMAILDPANVPIQTAAATSPSAAAPVDAAVERIELEAEVVRVDTKPATPNDMPAPQANEADAHGAAATAPRTTPDGPVSLSTGDIAFCFAGLKWTEKEWKKPLGDMPKWLEKCLEMRGQRGVREHRWNPVLIAATLVREHNIKANSARARFQTQPLLKPWFDLWKTYEADHFDTLA